MPPRQKSEKIGDVSYIILNTQYPEDIASFWGKVLGLEITDRSPPYVDLAPIAPNIILSFQQVSEPKTGKNRMHMDIAVGENLELAAERVHQLGGAIVKRCSESPYTWIQCTDPEGNEFCLVVR